MRKILFALTALAGAAAAAGHARAMPAAAGPVPVLSGAPELLSVQYYEDWRAREWHRREAFERWRRHEEWRRWRAYQRGYPRPW